MAKSALLRRNHFAKQFDVVVHGGADKMPHLEHWSLLARNTDVKKNREFWSLVPEKEKEMSGQMQYDVKLTTIHRNKTNWPEEILRRNYYMTSSRENWKEPQIF